MHEYPSSLLSRQDTWSLLCTFSQVPRGAGPCHPWWAFSLKPPFGILGLPFPSPSPICVSWSHLPFKLFVLVLSSPDLFPLETSLRQVETWVLEDPEQKSENYSPRAKSGLLLVFINKVLSVHSLTICSLPSMASFHYNGRVGLLG